MLLYITLRPLWKRLAIYQAPLLPHGINSEIGKLQLPQYRKIAITIDFSQVDVLSINHALAQGGKDAEYLLIHIVESAGAILMGNEIEDLETHRDNISLHEYLERLQAEGYQVACRLGHGNPKTFIPEIVGTFHADLLVMGAHGHRMIKDIIFGTTVEAVRHKLNIPVLIVRSHLHRPH
ncbi:hypothetical protein CCP3SC15_4150001 [Gammaproteobacteria bacterium]